MKNRFNPLYSNQSQAADDIYSSHLFLHNSRDKDKHINIPSNSKSSDFNTELFYCNQLIGRDVFLVHN